MMNQYSGPTCNFYWVRKANIFIDRLQNIAQPNLDPEAFNHWMAVARFFRGHEYSRLAHGFGDVPYFDRVIGSDKLDVLYKDRSVRGLVMDGVYEDFNFLLEPMRVDDGTQRLKNSIHRNSQR